MNRNWLLLAFALVALASCSVEKRVYQPGYHIEWNHFASQGQFQDVSQGRSEGASQDLPQDLSENLEIDVAQDATQDDSQGASQDLPQDLSKNLEIDVSQDASQDLSENLETGVSKREKIVQFIESVAPVQINSALAESQMGQKIDSDLALILFILLALLVPALTIFLLEGFSKNFWIALLLMICGLSLTSHLFLVGAILEVIAIVLAIGVVLNKS
jgi:predicted RND superfamily exporter protein